MRLDVAAYLGAWPFRELEGTPRGLRRMLQELDLGGALVSPLAGLFYTDPEPANSRLLRVVERHPDLWAAPIVNLRLASAGRYLARLAAHPRVRAVRIAPGFHGYAAAQAKEGLRVAAAHGLAVILQLRLQDERSHPVTSRVPPVAVADALALAQAVPEARLVLAATKQGELRTLAERLPDFSNLCLDISHLDGLGCLALACELAGPDRLLFSTSWPFFYAASAGLKVAEAELPPADLDRIMGGNAARVFGLT